MNLKKLKVKDSADEQQEVNVNKSRESKKHVSDSKDVNKKALEDLVNLYNKIQNDETVSKDKAVKAFKKILKKFPNASTEFEVLEDGDGWSIEWGDVGDVTLGYDCSTELWQVLREVIESSEFEMDVVAPESSDWDEYSDTIGKANEDITVIYGPWGSADPTEIVAYAGDVTDLLDEWEPVFVPKDNYFHSSGDVGEITLIGDENDLDAYLDELESSEGDED